MAPNYAIQLLSWHKAQMLARAIRHCVFVEEQCIPEELEWDEWDALSIHAVAVLLPGSAIATGRLLPVDAAGVIRLGRMAVLKPWRNCGVGSAILCTLLADARKSNVHEIVLHAQITAASLYRKHGFSECGGTFLEAGIPHVEMRLVCHDFDHG